MSFLIKYVAAGPHRNKKHAKLAIITPKMQNQFKHTWVSILIYQVSWNEFNYLSSIVLAPLGLYVVT